MVMPQRSHRRGEMFGFKHPSGWPVDVQKEDRSPLPLETSADPGPWLKGKLGAVNFSKKNHEKRSSFSVVVCFLDGSLHLVSDRQTTRLGGSWDWTLTAQTKSPSDKVKMIYQKIKDTWSFQTENCSTPAPHFVFRFAQPHCSNRFIGHFW